MDAVVLAGKDDVNVLQEHHPARQAEVRVRPLVNLVGQCHEDGQCKQVAVPRVDMVNLRWEQRQFVWKMFEETAQKSSRHCQVRFVDRKLTRGEGEEVEGHVC